MSELELPREAQQTLAQMRGLDAHMASLKEEFAYDLERVQKALADARSEFARLGADVERRAAQLRSQREQEEAALAETRALIDALHQDKVAAFEFIGRAFADYELARAQATAEHLRSKSHPAASAAEAVRTKGRELAEARRRMKVAEWVVALYELHFPWLTELRDLEEEQAFIAGTDGAEAAEDAAGERADPVRHWLTREEFEALSTMERNQRALDRYLRSRKTPWQLGRDYERYVGYLREQDGYTVSYQGIFKGLEDLGRDVIAERDGEIEVIQCKRWARHKVIHEKHVFQLFGTVVAMRIERPDARVRGTFVTTTSLSERAREFARQLEIRLEEQFPLADYPRIKCNLARASGERIYHLPFDQQYDATVIEPERGERFVATVAEAEQLGFRRAWRWRPDVSAA
jgi:Restriction endonuclease